MLEDVENLGDVLLILGATLTYGVEHAVDDVVEELLALHVADAAMGVSSLQLVEVLELRPEVGEVLIG